MTPGVNPPLSRLRRLPPSGTTLAFGSPSPAPVFRSGLFRGLRMLPQGWLRSPAKWHLDAGAAKAACTAASDPR